MNYIIYFAYNIIYEIFSIWFLLYANTYLNELLLPKNLKWFNGNLRSDLATFFYAKSILLIIEFILLLIIIVSINKWYLNRIFFDKNSLILNWTVSIYLIITLLFVLLLISTIFSK